MPFLIQAFPVKAVEAVRGEQQREILFCLAQSSSSLHKGRCKNERARERMRFQVQEYYDSLWSVDLLFLSWLESIQFLFFSSPEERRRQFSMVVRFFLPPVTHCMRLHRGNFIWPPISIFFLGQLHNHEIRFFSV